MRLPGSPPQLTGAWFVRSSESSWRACDFRLARISHAGCLKPRSLRNLACQAGFLSTSSCSVMMLTYWLTRCFDSPVVRVTNSMSWLCS